MKRFEQVFSACGMKLIEKKQTYQSNRLTGFTGETENELTPEILKRLDGRYTMGELLMIGLMLIMQK